MIELSLYHKLADNTLEEYQEELVKLQDSPSIEDLDIEYGNGVLTIKLGPRHGTYVINKQTPNKQIWFSSPKSGPKRYNWDITKKIWVNTRDGHALSKLFSDELTKIAGINISLSDPSGV